MEDFTSDVGEAEAAAVVFVGEFFVIETEEVEDGGMEVVYVNGIDGGFVTDFVGLTV